MLHFAWADQRVPQGSKSDVALPVGQHLDAALEQFYPFKGLYSILEPL